MLMYKKIGKLIADIQECTTLIELWVGNDEPKYAMEEVVKLNKLARELEDYVVEYSLKWEQANV